MEDDPIDKHIEALTKDLNKALLEGRPEVSAALASVRTSIIN